MGVYMHTLCVYMHIYTCTCIYIYLHRTPESIHRPQRKAGSLEGVSEDYIFWQPNCKLRLQLYMSHMPKTYEYLINNPLSDCLLGMQHTEHRCDPGELGLSSHNPQAHRVTPQEGPSPSADLQPGGKTPELRAMGWPQGAASLPVLECHWAALTAPRGVQGEENLSRKMVWEKPPGATG